MTALAHTTSEQAGPVARLAVPGHDDRPRKEQATLKAVSVAPLSDSQESAAAAATECLAKPTSAESAASQSTPPLRAVLQPAVS